MCFGMEENVKNYKMVVSYDGTRYFGWEHQPDTEMTIQGKLEQVLSRMLEDHPGVKTWRLDVRTQNMPAIALYEQFGFGIITENPNVYKDPVDNGYLMIRGAEN